VEDSRRESNVFTQIIDSSHAARECVHSLRVSAPLSLPKDAWIWPTRASVLALRCPAMR
jgi:hypothetical protein